MGSQISVLFPPYSERNGTCSINKLSNDALYLIFRLTLTRLDVTNYHDRRIQLKRLSCVCQRWKYIIEKYLVHLMKPEIDYRKSVTAEKYLTFPQDKIVKFTFNGSHMYFKVKLLSCRQTLNNWVIIPYVFTKNHTSYKTIPIIPKVRKFIRGTCKCEYKYCQVAKKHLQEKRKNPKRKAKIEIEFKSGIWADTEYTFNNDTFCNVAKPMLVRWKDLGKKTKKWIPTDSPHFPEYHRKIGMEIAKQLQYVLIRTKI